MDERLASQYKMGIEILWPNYGKREHDDDKRMIRRDGSGRDLHPEKAHQKKRRLAA